MTRGDFATINPAPARVHDCEHCRHWQVDAGETAEAVRVARVLAGLGGLIHDTRRQRGLSMRQVAAQSGVSFSTISRIESGVGQAEAWIAVRLIAWIENPPEAGLPPVDEPNSSQVRTSHD